MPILIALSVGIRLSNLIFLIALLIYQIQNKEIKDAIILFLKTIIFSILIYLPTHSNLFQYLKTLNYKIYES